MKPINIEPALNGFICQVGCQRVVFTSRVEMLRELDKYLLHPDEVEKEYRQNAIHRHLLTLAQPATAPMDAPQCAEVRAARNEAAF